jgi:hypothetical protein
MHPVDNITIESLDEIFKYHDHESKVPKYVAIRATAKEFARTILENCPVCKDTEKAIEHVRSAVMRANAGIAIEPVVAE